MSFTAGPWRIEDPLPETLVIIAPDRPGYTNEYRWVASVSTDAQTGILLQEAEANARLIAAAPLMARAIQLAELHFGITDNKCYDAPEGKRCEECIGCSSAMALAALHEVMQAAGLERI